ncbi:hypothetical protein RMATCC62417_06028 [Rhizopus microsporus]|nr:hypothetical protein RMATCC62417_06028 [Rhizopus microsporus]
MKRDFDIDLDFPLDSLCPAVPNRLNYILWLEDLVSETMQDDKIRGIDIGVGASCIYPLLGCARNPHWTFLGTDINHRSIEWAQENVRKNGLEDRITIRHNDDPEKILVIDEEKYTFCMCNPPFYESQEELEQGLANKELEPSAVCTGSLHEMITQGGEYGFISRMIKESLEIRTRIRWYTSMIGLKKSIWPLVRLLKASGITNYLITDLTQGKTTRWAIAWSFHPERAVKTPSLDEYRPKCQFVINLPQSVDFVMKHIQTILADLDIHIERQDCQSLIGTAKRNSWSRAARRQKRQKITHEPEKDLFTFEMILEPNTVLQISWTKGHDRNLFESFWSHVKKRIEEQCGLERGTKNKCFIEV